MFPILILGVLLSIPYGLYRAARKWGIWVVYLVASVVSFLGATGVVAEKLFGPEWGWNFGHHGSGYLIEAFSSGVVFLILGLTLRTNRNHRAAQPQPIERPGSAGMA